jgi:hypothetical protein
MPDALKPLPPPVQKLAPPIKGKRLRVGQSGAEEALAKTLASGIGLTKTLAAHKITEAQYHEICLSRAFKEAYRQQLISKIMFPDLPRIIEKLKEEALDGSKTAMKMALEFLELLKSDDGDGPLNALAINLLVTKILRYAGPGMDMTMDDLVRMGISIRDTEVESVGDSAKADDIQTAS